MCSWVCFSLGVGSEKAVRIQQADTQSRGYLDFADFKLFVKSLKARPELDRLFLKITNGEPGLRFAAFEQFMRTSQKVVCLPVDHLCLVDTCVSAVFFEP